MSAEGTDKARLFVAYFYKHIKDGNIRDITTMYDLTFTKISEDFFKGKPWPNPATMKDIVQDDIFWLLYNELYFRHLHNLFSRRQGSLGYTYRKASWDNYTALFSVLQNNDVSMKLPNNWLWDMVDEFLYQFQTYNSLAGSASQKPDDLTYLAANPDVWAVAQVTQILENFVAKSQIRADVARDNGQTIFETEGFVGNSNVLRMLGYFSLVGLCRLNCLLGKHDAALRTLSPLNPFINLNLFTFKVPMSNVNLYFYAGASFLMLRRYIDAGRCFNTILSFILRVKMQFKQAVFYDQMLNKNEAMYKLLAICVAMCPAVERWLSEQVAEQLAVKCKGDMMQMQNGHMETYRIVYASGCPKFVTAALPDLEGGQETSKTGYLAQVNQFLLEAEAAHQLPDLKKFLKLYTSITTEKLAHLLKTEVSTLMRVLGNQQKRIIQKRWEAGEAISGKEMATADVDFEILKDRESGQDLVVVKEQRMAANHLATLAKHIVRFEQVTKDMEQHLKAEATLAVAR